MCVKYCSKIDIEGTMIMPFERKRWPENRKREKKHE